MAYIRVKWIRNSSGNIYPYLYKVKGIREGKKVRQKVISYLGRAIHNIDTHRDKIYSASVRKLEKVSQKIEKLSVKVKELKESIEESHGNIERLKKKKISTRAYRRGFYPDSKDKWQQFKEERSGKEYQEARKKVKKWEDQEKQIRRNQTRIGRTEKKMNHLSKDLTCLETLKQRIEYLIDSTNQN